METLEKSQIKITSDVNIKVDLNDVINVRLSELETRLRNKIKDDNNTIAKKQKERKELVTKLTEQAKKDVDTILYTKFKKMEKETVSLIKMFKHPNKLSKEVPTELLKGLDKSIRINTQEIVGEKKKTPDIRHQVTMNMFNTNNNFYIPASADYLSLNKLFKVTSKEVEELLDSVYNNEEKLNDFDFQSRRIRAELTKNMLNKTLKGKDVLKLTEGMKYE